MELHYVKFGFIVLCFVISLYYKKPFAALFTAIADYFLVVLVMNEIGVTVFILAHLCYIARFSGTKKFLPFCALFIMPAFAAVWALVGQFVAYLVFVSAIYAQCFLFSLFCALAGFFRKQFPYPNGVFIAVGMILFVFCDICVLIFNVASGSASNIAFNLIWFFYAPSQLLLALSAKNFKVYKIS